MDEIVARARQNMIKALDVLKQDLATVRTGKATPTLVEHIVVSVYGGSARLKIMEVATISVSDPQTLLLTPFDQSVLDEIQKGIMEANIGFTPSNDGQHIRISIPPLSSERRQQLISLMKQKLENGRIMIRQSRHDGMNEVKKEHSAKTISDDEQSRLEKEIQRATDDVMNEIDALGKHKETELLQI